MKQRVDVSPEMATFIGAGAIDPLGWPDEPVMLAFRDIEAGGQTIELRLIPDESAITAALVLLVARQACRRLFPAITLAAGRWHLTADLRALANAIREDSHTPAHTTMRLARSIELLCETMKQLELGGLTPAGAAGTLTESEAARIVAARNLIDEKWQERPTLEVIARASGTNRAQLVRGFKEMYDCTVGDVLARNRLNTARKLLVRTEMPVASIGYRCGYKNNSSFTRAFTRHFGVAPSQVRRSAC